MSDKRRLICNLTEEVDVISEDLYTKKILLYGGEKNLKDYYIKNNIITLLSKGHTIKECSTLLGFLYIEEKENYYKDLVKFYNNLNNKKKSSTKSSNVIETDEDVKRYIEDWKQRIS